MGKLELIQTNQADKTEHEIINYFDTNWNKLDMYKNFPKGNF